MREDSFFMDSKRGFTLDEYGVPEMAIANRILVKKTEFGESREDLETIWEKWIHYLPFDAPVAEALTQLYVQRLEKLDKDNDAGEYIQLEQKLELVKKRSARYRMASFSQEE